eukprot:2399914-Rhodomonas_salina.1
MRPARTMSVPDITSQTLDQVSLGHLITDMSAVRGRLCTCLCPCCSRAASSSSSSTLRRSAGVACRFSPALSSIACAGLSAHARSVRIADRTHNRHASRHDPAERTARRRLERSTRDAKMGMTQREKL